MSELLKELVLKVEGLQYWNDHYKNCIQQGEQKTIHELGLYKKLSEINDKVEKIASEVCEEFSDHGTRHSIVPVGQFKDCGCFQNFENDNWQSYIRSMDISVRNRAMEKRIELNELTKQKQALMVELNKK